MKLAGLLRRERTTVTTVGTTTFNAPGIYYPPYGKTVIQLSGRGSPGNLTVSGTVSGSNYYEYMTYVPASGGSYSGDNSYNYGTYVPASGGSYAGSNPSTPGNVINSYVVALRNIRYIQYNSLNQTVSTDTYSAGQVLYYFDSSQYSPVSPRSFSDSAYYPPYTYVNTNGYDYFSILGSNYNPSISGNAYYNPYSPAYTYYTYVGGNANYNPYYPAYNYYTGVPGNPNYNPTVAGTTAPSYNVVGVSLPGGLADSAAPVIGFSTVSINYTNAGTPISVPPGGYVTVKNI